MSNNLPQNYNFENVYNIRVVLIDKKPWWVASDVCNALGYSNISKAIQDNCKEKGVTTSYIISNGGHQNYTMINKSNLYRLIIKSKNPNAEKFQYWIDEEVIPTIIRKRRYLLKQDSYPRYILN